MHAIPLRRLAAFYFFYLALLGGFMPYWSLYLHTQLSLTPARIGQLMAATLAARLLAPPFWGYLADRGRSHLRVVRVGCFMVTVLWGALMAARTVAALLPLLICYSFFQNAILAQFEAVTLGHLGAQRGRYGSVRLWGSLGFMVSVAALGAAFDAVSLAWLPAILALLSLLLLVCSLSVPSVQAAVAATAGIKLASVLRRREVLGFLGASFLLQLSHAPYYTFYSIFLEAHHHTHRVIGLLWALAVVAEVLAFAQMRRVLPVLGERCVLVVALLLAAVRWVVIGTWPDAVPLLIAMQLLHAASFAAFHCACISLLHRHFGQGHLGQGQALYGMLWGTAAALGSWAAGAWWTVLGPGRVFTLAALPCLLACVWLLRMTVPVAMVAPEPAVRQAAG